MPVAEPEANGSQGASAGDAGAEPSGDIDAAHTLVDGRSVARGADTGAAFAADTSTAADGAAKSDAGTTTNSVESPRDAGADTGVHTEADRADGSTPSPSAKPQCYGLDLPPRALTAPISDLSALDPYYPTKAFRTATPAAAGFDEAKLNEAVMFSTPHSNTDAILVLRKGYIVAERYFNGANAETRFESFSIAKSFTSALVGIAIGAGKIPGVDERLCKYYPKEWNCDDAQDPRSRITVSHAMNLQTGLAWSEEWTPDGLFTNDAVWGFLTLDLLDYVLTKPATMEPGKELRYSTGSPALLSGVIQGATGKTALAYAKEVLFDPIGIPDVQWSADPKGRTTTYAGLQATAREYAKFGHLYAKHGQWEGREVVPASWVDLTTKRVSECEDRYRFLWHLNPTVRFGMPDATTCTAETFLTCKPLSLANLPGEGFLAQGITGQFLFIFPTSDLVVVRMASDEFNGAYWDEYAREMLARLFDAIR